MRGTCKARHGAGRRTHVENPTEIRENAVTNNEPVGHPSPESSHSYRNNEHDRHRTPTIADRYADLLSTLSERQRRAIVLRLTVGFYEGWNPGRGEVADLVAEHLGLLSPEDALQRQRQRNAGERIPDFIPRVLAARRHS